MDDNGVPAASAAFQTAALFQIMGFSSSLTGTGDRRHVPEVAAAALYGTTGRVKWKVNVLHGSSGGVRLH